MARALATGLVIAAGLSLAPGLPPVAAATRIPRDELETHAVPLQRAAGDTTYPALDRYHDANLMGLTITNYGFFGNDFVTRAPSMEYPLGSLVDHLIRAGLWIGAVTSTPETLVTTGAVDGTWGNGGYTQTEFTPRSLTIHERSTLKHNASYDTLAVSEQDFVVDYDDTTAAYEPGALEQHRPLGIRVHQESYAWSYDFANAFVIVNMKIRNIGIRPGVAYDLSNLYLGIYAELASGYKDPRVTWRPSGWFSEKVLSYSQDQNMIEEHRCDFGSGSAPYWAGIKILGTNPPWAQLPSGGVSLRWWDWEPGSTARDQDAEKYALMATRGIDSVQQALCVQDDPVELISAGPFPGVGPGDSLEIAFAFVGGSTLDNLLTNASWAQRAYDKHYVLPSPPESPGLVVTPREHSLELTWEDSPESTVDPFSGKADFEGYRIYVTRKPAAMKEDLNLVAELDRVDSIGYNTGFARVELPADSVQLRDGYRYKYRYTIDNLKDGFQYWVGVTAFDTGDRSIALPSLESGFKQNLVMAIPGTAPAASPMHVSVFPNPFRGEAVWDGPGDREKYIWFTNMPARALLRIYTLSGDLVDSIDFDKDTYTGALLDPYDPRHVQGIKTSGEDLVLSGGMCAWDLISRNDEPVASGLYVFAVKDLATGEESVGKFMVIR